MSDMKSGHRTFPRIFGRKTHVPRYTLRQIVREPEHVNPEPAYTTNAQLVPTLEDLKTFTEAETILPHSYTHKPTFTIAVDVVLAVARQRVAVLTAADRLDALRVCRRHRRIDQLTEQLLQGERKTEENLEQDSNVLQEVSESKDRSLPNSQIEFPNIDSAYSNAIDQALLDAPVFKSLTPNCAVSIQSHSTIDEISHWVLRMAVVQRFVEITQSHTITSASRDTLATWFLRNECQLFVLRLMTASTSSWKTFLETHPLARTHQVRILSDIDKTSTHGRAMYDAAAYFSMHMDPELTDEEAHEICVLPWQSNPQFPNQLLLGRRRAVVIAGYALVQKCTYVALCLAPHFESSLRAGMETLARSLLRQVPKPIKLSEMQIGLDDTSSDSELSESSYTLIRSVSRKIISHIKLIPLVQDLELATKQRKSERTSKNKALKASKVMRYDEQVYRSDCLPRPSSWTPSSFYAPVWLLALTKVLQAEKTNTEAGQASVASDLWSDEYLGDDLATMRTNALHRLHERTSDQSTSTMLISPSTASWSSEKHLAETAESLPLDGVSPEEVDQAIDTLAPDFPPCMLYMYRSLLQDRHLKHYGRVQLALFLKDIGLPLPSSLAWWRRRLLRTGFLPENEYNILHHYGKLGRGEPYRAYDCINMCASRSSLHAVHASTLASVTPKHGCPFTHLSLADLAELLQERLRRASVIEQNIASSSSSSSSSSLLPSERLLKVMAEAAWASAEASNTGAGAARAIHACREYLRQCQPQPPEMLEQDQELGGGAFNFSSPVEWFRRSQFWKQHVGSYRSLSSYDMDEDEDADDWDTDHIDKLIGLASASGEDENDLYFASSPVNEYDW